MNNSKTRILIALLFFLLFIFIFLFIIKFINLQPITQNTQLSISPTPTLIRQKAYVNFVFDGDTIELQGKITLRLLGIDAPETSNKYTKFASECFASDSAKIAKELMMGQNVEIEKDVEDKDKYGRLLRYVWVDEVFVNEFLVRNGYAKLESSNKLNFKYQKELEKAQDEAKREKRGLWRECKFDT